MLNGTPLTGEMEEFSQRTVWEIMLEMERFKCQAGEKDQGMVAFVLDLGLGDSLHLLEEDLAGAMWEF